jgi:hypothetical protein
MKNYMKFSILILSMFILANVEAQGLDDFIGFDDGLNDVTTAPIHFLIPVAIIIGVVLGVRKLR